MIYRTNSPPAIDIPRMPVGMRVRIWLADFWYDVCNSEAASMLKTILVVMFVLAFAASIIFGIAAAAQFVVTGFVGHPIGQYPHYCVLTLGIYLGWRFNGRK